MSKKILDLGCGKGQHIPQLLGKGDLTCLDIDPHALDIARSKYPFFRFVCASVEEASFDHEEFNEIYCFDVLEHVADFDRVMRNINLWLKRGGLLYVEIPYDKSEEWLLKTNPNYFQQIGHKRIFRYEELEKIFSRYHFKLIKKVKSRGIVNLYLWTLFKLGIEITDQMGTTKGSKRFIERLLFLLIIWFDKNLFNTFLRYIPFWIMTMPIGALISSIYPKTIILRLRKYEQ